MISRDLSGLGGSRHDLVIVGAGVQGVALALEALAGGRRPLLVDRGDFGAGTSANTLRVIHGGLRYLQSMDLRRFFSSVEQRRWWSRAFPELVSPVTCVMPLYGHGLRRPTVFRAALALNDLLSRFRNDGVDPEGHIPNGRVLSPEEVLREFPGCRRDGLRGGAQWTDGSMVSSQRLLIEMVRWVVAAGGTALNYVSARTLLRQGDAVVGVVLRDEITATEYEIHTPLVVNAAGPWSQGFVDALGGDGVTVFRPALAFNVLLRRPLPARKTVAVSAEPGGPIRFLRPVGDCTFAGTVHLPWSEDVPWDHDPMPAEEQVAAFVAELDRALPDFGVSTGDVVRVFPGLLPAGPSDPEPLHHPVVVDHGRRGGPKGLVTVAGVKFTTAPAVARTTLQRVFGGSSATGWSRMNELRPTPRAWSLPVREDLLGDLDPYLRARKADLRTLVEEESVQFAEDLVYGRLDWRLVDVDLAEVVTAVGRVLGVDPARGPGAGLRAGR